jgi:hypothetical protein
MLTTAVAETHTSDERGQAMSCCHRLRGLFTQSTNDFTVSGVLKENFAGTLKFDNDGDFTPNGTLAMQVVACATIVIPWPTAPTP